MRKLSDVYSNFLNGFSLLIWLWMIIDFVSMGVVQVPSTVSGIYLILLGYYASDKELKRRKKKKWGERYGELFVYAWSLSFVIIVAFYRWGGRDLGYDIPAELPVIVGGVLVIFFVTEYLKLRYKQKTSRH